jgi:cellulose synthase/poly-beta-1,6-N-acetylglucosamine synthase-like glycosyltransferase
MKVEYLAYLIIFFGSVNLIRMTMFLVGSDLYGLLVHWYKRRFTTETNLRRKDLVKKMLGLLERFGFWEITEMTPDTAPYLPTFSVVIPANNEERTIIACVESVVKSDYPSDKLEIVVVVNGSTDKTAELVARYKEANKVGNLKLVVQANAGKSIALNNGIVNHTSGELVMCLDADSYLTPEAIRQTVKYFQDKKVASVAANVKIVDRGTLLNLIQRFEYLICYQMKRAQTLFNIEYIIGGIGSTFRRSVLARVGYYDTNTVTEDIDLTMKILQLGNRNVRVIYGADVVVHTESVMSLSGLIRQRYRWKWGRCQTFLKNRNMFFSGSSRFTKGLTWFYLPYAIFGDFAFLLEPLIIGYILYIIVRYGDTVTLTGAFLVITSYIFLNVAADDSTTLGDKVKLMIITPAMYFYFYILSFVEYVALIKSLINIKNLQSSIDAGRIGWDHVERPKVAMRFD